MSTAMETYRYSRLRIRYFEKEIPAVAVGRAVYFPMRALCDALGMAPQTQITRLREDSRFAEAFRTIPIPTVKGLRDAVCINKRQVGMWLGSIDPHRCPLTALGPISQFQRELFDAADRFLFGNTSDSAYDPATKSDQPIGGTLKVGHCPGCGMLLVLDIDAGGMHLREDSSD